MAHSKKEGIREKNKEKMMSGSGKTEYRSSSIKRREFCKTIPCAAIGLFSLSGLTGMSFNEETKNRTFKEPVLKMEEIMAKKITSVKVKVLSQKGSCALGHKAGDIINITETGIEGKICIHALYSMFPAVFAMLYEAQFSWLKDPDKKTHACPDAANPVVFEIARIREKVRSTIS
jgi:uncharacterized repeat protein (TIGR04076 family)